MTNKGYVSPLTKATVKHWKQDEECYLVIVPFCTRHCAESFAKRTDMYAVVGKSTKLK